jgi:hypothetical protein
MEANYLYTCPYCSQQCSIAESLAGHDVVCPSCSQTFFATPPNDNSQIILPEKLPFFKSGRKKILEQKLQEAVAHGELSEQDDQKLRKTASLLGLSDSDLSELEKQDFMKEVSPIQQRIEESWQLTDQDIEEIAALKRKYGVKDFTMEAITSVYRQIYLLEEKRQLPSQIQTDLMLESGETAYYCVGSAWLQSRVHSQGYAGASVSVPTGISGVRLRFGRYSPVRSEEITPLASGTLWVTSKRLIFQGDRRNTQIEHRKIIDAHVYSDSLRVEKATGKPDYFSMDGPRARYIMALIGDFKATP